MIEIIVVRHGETIENKQRIIQGQSEGYLSDYGKQKNKELGVILKHKKINKIYTSTLIRAVDTAKEIYKHHANIELEYADSLMEWNLGVLEGKKYPENLEITSDWEGKEKPDSVKKRLMLFLDKIVKEHHNKTILLVSHGLTIKVLSTILNKLPLDNIYKLELMDNSSFAEFKLYNL